MKKVSWGQICLGKAADLIAEFLRDFGVLVGIPSHCEAFYSSTGHRSLLEAPQEPVVLRMQQKGTASLCHASSFWRLCPLSCAPPLWDISSFLSIESIWEAICGRSMFFLKTRLDLGWEPRAGATLVFGKMLTHDLTKQPQTRGCGGGHLQLRSQPKLRTNFCHEYHFPGGLGDRRGMEIMPL